jgi:hypothetical protein
MNNTNNASRIISLINNVYLQSVFYIFKQQNNSNNIDSNTLQTHDNNNNNTSLSRSRLQMVWDRLQTLSVRQRNSILNAITNSSLINNENYIFRRAVSKNHLYLRKEIWNWYSESIQRFPKKRRSKGVNKLGWVHRLPFLSFNHWLERGFL